MINKSLAIKNKLYLFLSLVFSFLLFLYLIYFLFNGERGVISYYKIKNQQQKYVLELNELQEKNKYLLDRIARLQTNTLDLDYLDEKLRKNGLILEDEIFINIEN
tara:strand:- start:43 stop:357 length:315 start_codon:yes stop_codon:yes gene_type:complete